MCLPPTPFNGAHSLEWGSAISTAMAMKTWLAVRISMGFPSETVDRMLEKVFCYLKGDGTFEWVDSTLSGIDLPGEGRGLAVAISTKSSSGLRCHSAIVPNPGVGKPRRETRHHAGVGHRWEPSAIGHSSAVDLRRWVQGSHARDPSGRHWSQSSTRPILGMAKEPRELEIHWPGGISEIIADPRTS